MKCPNGNQIWKYLTQGGNVVIWGAGSKGVTFLNVVGSKKSINYVIDLNPHKYEKFIPRTGKQVKPPEFLATYRPDMLVVMNPIYFNEISRSIESIDFKSKVVCV